MRNMINDRNGLILFSLSIMLIIGGLIGSFDLNDYTLYHTQIESLIERRTWSLEGSLSGKLQPNGDVFEYEDRTMAIKQPGIGYMGSKAYFILSKLGITYYDRYHLTASIVTLLISTLPLSIFAGVMFKWMDEFTRSKKFAYLSSISIVFSSTLFPYGTNLHHDIIATSILGISYYLIYLVTNSNSKNNILVFASGFLLTYSLLFSMLHFALTLFVAFGVMIIIKNAKKVSVFLIGLLTGIYPSLEYNYWNLGGITHFPNIVGNASDTFLQLSPSLFFSNLSLYLFKPGLSIIFNTPLIILAAIGMLKIFRRNSLIKLLTYAGIIHILYVLNIFTVGHSQYGPRYLIPLFPTYFLGLSYFSEGMRIGVLKKVAIISFLFMLPGAIWGTMFPDLDKLPYIEMWSRIIDGFIPLFPLLILLPIGTIVFLYHYKNYIDN